MKKRINIYLNERHLEQLDKIREYYALPHGAKPTRSAAVALCIVELYFKLYPIERKKRYELIPECDIYPEVEND